MQIVQAQRRSYSAADYEAALTQANANINLAHSLDEIARATGTVTEELTKRSRAGLNAFGASSHHLQQDGPTGPDDVVKDAEKLTAARAAKTSQDFNDNLQQQEQGVRTLAGLYRDLFRDGTKGVFDDFLHLGEDALAKLAAKETFSLLSGLISGGLSGGGGGIGGLLGGLSGATPHSDTGGSFVVGGGRRYRQQYAEPQRPACVKRVYGRDH